MVTQYLHFYVCRGLYNAYYLRDLHKIILSQGLQIGNEIGDQFQNQSFTNYVRSLSSVILTSNYPSIWISKAIGYKKSLIVIFRNYQESFLHQIRILNITSVSIYTNYTQHSHTHFSQCRTFSFHLRWWRKLHQRHVLWLKQSSSMLLAFQVDNNTSGQDTH